MSKSEVLAKRLADHGRHVFVYNHIWTNQVVYSLDRSLNNNQALKQLPFAGKKTLPPALRKDMWRPLLTVSFPTPPQGLHAFRKLREYRKLHELNWATPETESGDKRNPTKKLRGRIIMNQKANTIADLAQVLREQSDLAEEKIRKDRESNEKEQHRIREELLSLTREAEDGGIPKLDAALLAQEEAVNTMRKQKSNKDPNAPTRSFIQQSIVALKRLQTKREKMIAAKEAVDAAKKQALNLGTSTDARGQVSPESIDLTIDPPEIFYQQDPSSKRAKQPKYTSAPLYSTEGVVIRWTNPLDAEFAPSWPEGVVHDAAGLVRHTALAAEDNPVFTTEELVSRNTSHKYKALRAQRDDEVPMELLQEGQEPQQPTA